LQHLQVLPSRWSAKSQKLPDLCLGGKHPKASGQRKKKMLTRSQIRLVEGIDAIATNYKKTF
jgi:hypothetical protein